MEHKMLENDEVEIDLREVFMVLLSHTFIIILGGLLAALIGFSVSKFLIPPTYESTTKIYILNKQDNATVTYSDVQLGTQLTKDYKELVQSRYVLEQVIQKLELGDLTYETLLKKVDVTTPTDTRILAITVVDTNPMLAMEIANEIRETAAVHIKKVMDIQAVNIVETANLPTQKAGPSVMKWTLIGGSLGIIFLSGFYLIRFFLNDTIRTSDDIEKYLGLSTLAIIPLVDSKKSK